MRGSNKPHTKDPRGGWRVGKKMKRETKRFIRRAVKLAMRDPE